MANEQMEKNAQHIVIREMKIKTAMRIHYMPISIAKAENTDTTKCWQSWRTTGTLNPLLVGIQNGIATLEDSLAASYKTKHILTVPSRNHTSW